MSAHPIILPILAFLALFGASWLVLQRAGADRLWPTARLVALAALALPGVMLLYVAHRWLVYPSFFDHAEASVASVAQLVFAGLPLYHGFDDGPVYNNNYGPSFYYLIAAWYWALGPSIVAAKWYGLGCLATTIVAFGLSLRRAFGGAWALVGSLALVAVLLRFEHISFWVRPDPFVLALVALGLLASTYGSRAPRLTAVAIGVLSALAFTAKVHGMIYFLPAVFLHPYGVQLHRRVAWFLLPFLLTVALMFMPGNVSPVEYVAWIRLMTKQGIQPQLLARIGEEIVWMTLPLALAAAASWRAQGRASAVFRLRAPLIATLVAMAPVAVLASKPGAGAHHMLPFAMPLLYACIALVREALADRAGEHLARATAIQALVIAAALTFALVGTAKGFMFARGLDQGEELAGAIAELRRVQREHPGVTLGMAYGDSHYGRTFLRVLLVFDGQPYDFDAPAVAEVQMSGRPLPPAARGLLRSGHVAVYLVPAGTRPFSLESPYSIDGSIGMGHARRNLFDAAFVQAFMANYALTARGRYYDTWQYRAAPTAVNGP